jgi:hypothetical protein
MTLTQQEWGLPFPGDPELPQFDSTRHTWPPAPAPLLACSKAETSLPEVEPARPPARLQPRR